MEHKFSLIPTKSFTNDVTSFAKKDKSLNKKLLNAIEKLKLNPFEGKVVEGSLNKYRRVWVGTGHRLFYRLDGDKMILLRLMKKDKHTYK